MDPFTLRKIEFDAVRRIVGGFCACSLGKGLAGRIGPSRNPDVVNRWLEQTTQMVAAIRDVGLPPFGGITDITPALDRARPSGGATAEDFAQIAASLQGAAALRSYLLSLARTWTNCTSWARPSAPSSRKCKPSGRWWMKMEPFATTPRPA